MSLKSFIRTLLLLYVAVSVAVLVVKVSGDRPSVALDSESPPTSRTETDDSTESLDGETVTDPSSSHVPGTLAAQDLSPNRIIVYYFHRTIRCVGCINVEEASFETVSNDFEREIGEGILEWRSVNIDEPENAHFIDKYNLYYQELVFVELRDGVEARWDDIAEVWRHWNSKPTVRTVVRDELKLWLEGVGE